MIKIDVSIEVEARSATEQLECDRLVRNLIRELGDRRIKVAVARSSSREMLVERFRDLKTTVSDEGEDDCDESAG